MLKAIKPEVIKETKPKIMISGESGAGKTMFSLNFPTPYFIDTEGGATRPQYRKKLIDVGGAYFGKDQGSNTFRVVNDEIKALATTKHDYKTVVIDSASYLYMMEAAQAEENVGSDYGRDKKEANKPSRQLLRWIDKIGMNVIMICHAKQKWERKKNGQLEYGGSTFDFYDKAEFLLDLWIEIESKGDQRYFTVMKSRLDQFPKGKSFPLDYSRFKSLYGEEIIDKESTPIKLATLDDVKKVKSLLEIVKIDPSEVEKWLNKAEADDWDEMNDEQIGKVIAFLEKKLYAVKEAA